MRRVFSAVQLIGRRRFCSSSERSGPTLTQIFRQSAENRLKLKEVQQECEDDADLAYQLKEVDEVALKKFEQGLESHDTMVPKEKVGDAVKDYEMLLRSLREKRRLTIEWTDITDDDMDAVKRTAKQVGFKME